MYLKQWAKKWYKKQIKTPDICVINISISNQRYMNHFNIDIKLSRSKPRAYTVIGPPLSQ